MSKFIYSLKNLKDTKQNGYKVFSLFCGGGGSSIGYKLAGFDVIGGVEIDPKQAQAYKKNLKPKYFYEGDIRDFKNENNLPEELYNLDILDASPPCSLFSSANTVAEQKKGKKVKFAEGRVLQVLDDLFFETIEVIEKLQPKVAIMENVKGLLFKKNTYYVEEIYKRLNAIGYNVKHMVLNAADFGVPQKRQRVFFIASKQSLDTLKIKPLLSAKEHYRIKDIDSDYKGQPATAFVNNLIKHYKKGDKSLGDIRKRIEGKRTGFSFYLVTDNDVCNTLRAGSNDFARIDHNNIKFSKKELIQIQTFPIDYDFSDISYIYALGMSVPPFLTKEIAKQIKEQLLDI